MVRNTKVLTWLFLAAVALAGWLAANGNLHLFPQASAARLNAAATNGMTGTSLCCAEGNTKAQLLAQADGKPATEQPTPPPGSPSATKTIDGSYLPPPPPKFGGMIGLTAKDSKSYWPPRVVPTKDAPNVL